MSGGFDPIHVGHLRLFQEARRLGDKLVVILNNDNWLKSKKGFTFMHEKERVELIRSFPFVDKVVVTKHRPNDQNRTVSRELAALKPAIFANGGDRIAGNTPEKQVCDECGITMVFNVGRGGKMQSSSWLTNRVAKEGVSDVRPWGYERIFRSEKHYWVKMLTVSPGHRFSLQSHRYRTEHWVCVEGTLTAEINGKKKTLTIGDSVSFPPGTKHRLASAKGGTIVEVAYGPRVVETDFVRYEDDYGRA